MKTDPLRPEMLRIASVGQRERRVARLASSRVRQHKKLGVDVLSSGALDLTPSPVLGFLVLRTQLEASWATPRVLLESERSSVLCERMCLRCE